MIIQMERASKLVKSYISERDIHLSHVLLNSPGPGPLYSIKDPRTAPTATNIPGTPPFTAAPVYDDGVADAVPVVPVPVVEVEFVATGVKFAHVNLVVLLE